MSKKTEQIFALKIEGLEDVQKFKEILKELQNTLGTDKKLTFDQASPYYKEIKRLYEEMVQNVYPEMKATEEHIEQLTTDRKPNDKLRIHNYPYHSIKNGGGAILKQIEQAEEATIQKKDYGKEIDIPNNSEKLTEEVQKFLLSELLTDKFGEKVANAITKSIDMKDLMDIDHTQKDARQQLEKEVMSKLASLNPTVDKIETILNLIALFLKSFQEAEKAFQSPFNEKSFESFKDFKSYNEKYYQEAENYLSNYLKVEEKTKAEILKLYREQIDIKTQYYKEEYELKKRYGIDQDFSVGDQAYRMLGGQNPVGNTQKYLVEKEILKAKYDRNLERNDLKIGKQNLEIAKNINPKDLLKVVNEPLVNATTSVATNTDMPRINFPKLEGTGTVRQATNLVGGGGVSYLVPPTKPAAENTPRLEDENQKKNELYKLDAQNFAAAHKEKGNILQQFTHEFVANKDNMAGIFGEMKQLGADNSLFTGILDSAQKHLPKLLDLFKKTNKEINTDVQKAGDERNKVIGEGAEKGEEITQTSIENMKSGMQMLLEGVGLVFDALNQSLDSKKQEAEDRYKVISEKYDEVADRVAESNNRIKELQDEAQNAQGGRLAIIEEQISREIESRNLMAREEERLASEKLKAEADIEKIEKQKKKNELKEKLIQTIANTAFGIAQAVTASPLTFGLPWSAFVAITGAIQASTISKQLSKLADGGLLGGRLHSDGGMRIEGTNIEVEGGEYVINRQSTRRNLGLVSYINSQRRQLTPQDIDGYFASSGSHKPRVAFKTMFADGGELPSGDSFDSYGDNAVLRAIQSINLQPVVSVVDIAHVQQNMVQVTDWTNTR